MKKIGIIGCGWLGLHLAKYLSPNYKIFTTTTSDKKKDELTEMGFQSIAIQFCDDEILQENRSWEFLNGLDIIIITVPFSKRTNIKSLEHRFENISLFIKGFKKQIFLMSSIGIYPQVEIEMNEENVNTELLEPNIYFVEELMKKNFAQLNILRLGGLMGGTRIFSNYHVTNTNQIVNHVHFLDICIVIEKMINQNSERKTYNVVAPLHPTKQEIINCQKGIDKDFLTTDSGRKINSDILIRELNYQFKYPDPILFD